MSRAWTPVVGFLALGWVALYGAGNGRVRAVPRPVVAAPPAVAVRTFDKAAPTPNAPAAGPKLRYIAVGGGATPEYTEVSLEQDIQLAQQVLPGPGALLFAGGSDSASVRTLSPTLQSDTLLHKLGDLFDPRATRDSRYRRTKLTAQAATLDNFDTTLKRALAGGGGEPLLVYIATHGLQGDRARDNRVELWGGEPLEVAHLDALTADPARRVRFVIASCYSGGFAELAFKGAEVAGGASAAQRCGLFAGTWDRQTSGCDPNPDRRVQEGYSLHVLHALRGQDRAGQSLPLSELDLDGDGKVGLLEAHTRARIASHSIDVPTTTSERYLREVERREAKPNSKLSPEDAAVVQKLGARLGLLTRAAVDKRYKELGSQLDAVQDELDAKDAELDRSQAKLSARVLARWPVLNDPYHDDFAATLKQSEAAIAALLVEAPEAREGAQLREQTDALAERAGALEADEAVTLRLLRAYETQGLAASLAARGGAAFKHYQALLACERGTP